MKCLSLRQPYAELLISGKKTIELRNWDTKFRGKFLIHASKKVDKERSESLGINHENLIRGAIIGTANLYDFKQYKSKAELEKDKNKPYADGAYEYGWRDISGFSALCNDLNDYPEAIIYFLNEYFATAIKIINGNRGVLYKFVGDGILASAIYFGSLLI